MSATLHSACLTDSGEVMAHTFDLNYSEHRAVRHIDGLAHPQLCVALLGIGLSSPMMPALTRKRGLGRISAGALEDQQSSSFLTPTPKKRRSSSPASLKPLEDAPPPPRLDLPTERIGSEPIRRE